jgi:hypothetical protein
MNKFTCSKGESSCFWSNFFCCPKDEKLCSLLQLKNFEHRPRQSVGIFLEFEQYSASWAKVNGSEHPLNRLQKF